MTDDDIVTVIQANKFSSDPLAIYRAVIAARDEELRKQEPHEALRYGVSPNQCLRADTKEEGRQMRVSQKTVKRIAASDSP